VLPSNLSRLVDFFRSASQRAIGDVHEAFLRMMSKSSKLSKALGGSGLFVAALVGRLRSSENLVLRSLLKMLQLLHQHHPNPRQVCFASHSARHTLNDPYTQLVLDFDLYTIVRSFAQDESQVRTMLALSPGAHVKCLCRSGARVPKCEQTIAGFPAFYTCLIRLRAHVGTIEHA
jgi:hypothetical protein